MIRMVTTRRILIVAAVLLLLIPLASAGPITDWICNNPFHVSCP